MSTILEALRKSERARRHRQAPVYRDASSRETPPLLRWLALAAGLVLLVALGLSVWLMTRPPVSVVPGETPAAETAPVTTAPAAQEPAASPRMPSAVSEPQPLSAQTPPEQQTAAVAAPDADAGTGEAPWLSSLPPSFRNRLPALVVNIHVFAEDEAQRILYINNRPYKRGEQIPGGVVVEAIVPDGVVLRAFGQRFKLPRPT